MSPKNKNAKDVKYKLPPANRGGKSSMNSHAKPPGTTKLVSKGQLHLCVYHTSVDFSVENYMEIFSYKTVCVATLCAKPCISPETSATSAFLH